MKTFSTIDFPTAEISALRDVSGLLYSRGWAFGTSGNYSVVLNRDPLRLLVTASGKDKRQLAETDFVIVDEQGNADPAWSVEKPSAETMLHVTLAARPDVGSVLHTHSVWSTLLSERHFAAGALEISGYEMLKGLSGISTHEASISIPIFENTQDISALAGALPMRLNPSYVAPHAFLLRGHGLYAWGRNLAEARRHVEILEFLFEVIGRRADGERTAL